MISVSCTEDSSFLSVQTQALQVIDFDKDGIISPSELEVALGSELLGSELLGSLYYNITVRVILGALP